MQSCNVLIYGGGAVGGVFGWRLAQHLNNRVSVVCRSNYDRIKNAGFALRTSTWENSGRFMPDHVYRAGPFADPTPQKRFDYVVCANKVTTDSSSVVRDLQRFVGPDTTLVAAQNGMNVETPLQDAFPRNTVLSAICNIGCSQVRPGLIEQTARIDGSAFLVGVHRPSGEITNLDTSRRDRLAEMDPQFKSIDRVREERWRKLVFNSAWNSVTALTNLNTHELFQYPGAIEIVHQIAKEAYCVGVASGVELDSNLPSRTIELARVSAPIVPSTLQDARSGKPMELTPIFAYVVSQASRVGVDVPHLTLLHDLLQQKNQEMANPREQIANFTWSPAESQSFLTKQIIA